MKARHNENKMSLNVIKKVIDLGDGRTLRSKPENWPNKPMDR